MWAMKYLLENKSYQEAIEEILLEGGDTDTNACIIGGILGCRDGFEALKYEWAEKIVKCD